MVEGDLMEVIFDYDLKTIEFIINDVSILNTEFKASGEVFIMAGMFGGTLQIIR